MSDFVVSLIRTWIPAGVAAAVGYFTTLGFEYSAEAEAQLAGVAVALFAAVYYWGARALESRWPAAGYLLGVAKAPSYPDE